MKQNNLLLIAAVATGAMLLKKKQSVSGIGYAAAQKPFWYGIENIQFISHGNWSDPEIYYRGKYYNAAEVEEILYEEYSEQVAEELTDLSFEDWMLSQGNTIKYDTLPYIQPTSVWTQPFSKSWLKGDRRISGIGRINPDRDGIRVIFRTEKSGEYKGEVFAVFPDYWNGRYVEIFCSDGHTEADPGWIQQKTRPATESEYAPLLKAMRNMGYDNLIIAQRQ